MTQLPELDDKTRRQLEDEDPDALRAYERQRKRALDIQYPKPEITDIRQGLDRLRAQWEEYSDTANEHRELRYQLDRTPKKYERHIESAGEDGRPLRVHSRLGHNEIMRVVANQTRNPWRIDVPPHAAGEAADKLAEKQTRFANQLLAAWERESGKPLRRMACDAQASDGMGVWELYISDAYDQIDFERRTIDDEDDIGEPITREESDKEYLDRTERELIEAGLAICARTLDPLSVWLDFDGQGLRRVFIAEWKQYNDLYAAQLERYANDPEKLRELELPAPDMEGFSIEDHFGPEAAADGLVECVRYYDRRWYVEIVGDYVVQCVEHRLPRVPVFLQEGMVTSSSRMAWRYQGITWGMDQLERRINDLLTLGVDISYAYSRPHPVVLTPLEGQVRMTDGKKPDVLDLSDPSRVPQLEPGQSIADAFAGFKPNLQLEIFQELNRLYQHSGLNPIAAGQSPGSDPAGYTVNALQGATLANYEVLVDNEARTAAEMVDFVRQCIKHRLQERMYLTASKKGKSGGSHIEWLALGPDDITDVPCTCTVDPMSDTQRLVIRQSLTQGWKDGVVPRRVLQEKGYGADDPDLWDDDILRDKAMERIAALLVDVAMQRVGILFQPPPATPGPGGGVPGVPGALPASPQPPTVGGDMAAASQGPPGAGGGGSNSTEGLAAAARGGQANGYVPPPGTAGTTGAS